MDMNSFIWVSRRTFLGGAHYSAVATLPVAKNQLVSDIHGQLSGGGGFADSYYLPLILGWNKERASIRALAGFLAPTGRFTEGASDNVGSGYWTPTLSSGQTVQLTADNSVTFSAFQLYEWHTTQARHRHEAWRHDQSRLLVAQDIRVRKGSDASAGRPRGVRAAPDDGEDGTSGQRGAIPRAVRDQCDRVRDEPGLSESPIQCRRQVLRGVRQSRRVPGIFVPGVRSRQLLTRIRDSEKHMDLKQAAISISMIVFVLSSMLGMGLGLRVSEIVAPLRNWRLVTLSLVANFVVMPFAALALARILRLDESMGIGLLLLGLAAGAPFLPKLAQIAKGQSRVCRRTDGAADGDYGGLLCRSCCPCCCPASP